MVAQLAFTIVTDLERIAADVIGSSNYYAKAELQENPNYQPKIVFRSGTKPTA
jgi:hypothetical protein